MVNRIKQPEGCIGIGEKCVFAGKSLSSRYREQLKDVRAKNFYNTDFFHTLVTVR